MILAVISDVHGNKLALDTVINHMNQFNIDRIYFLGDAVNYYPECNQVIDCLIKNEAISLKGNHDNMIVSNQNIDPATKDVYNIEETKKKLSTSNLDFLQKLPLRFDFELQGLKVLMVHGSPFDELNGYIFPDTDITAFENIGYDFIFMGHTHRPMVRKIGNVRIANPGSVGMPRDIGNQGSYLVFNTDDFSCKIHRIPLPVKEMIIEYGDLVHPAVLKLLKRK